MLVTRDLNFIAKFVLHWLAHSKQQVINIDKLFYAGNLNNLSSVRHHSQHQFFQHGIGRPSARILINDYA